MAGKSEINRPREWVWIGSEEIFAEIAAATDLWVGFGRTSEWIKVGCVEAPMGSTLLLHSDGTLSVHVSGALAPVRVGLRDKAYFEKKSKDSAPRVYAEPGIVFEKMRDDIGDALHDINEKLELTRKTPHMGFKEEWLEKLRNRVSEWLIAVDIHVKNGQLSESYRAFNEVFSGDFEKDFKEAGAQMRSLVDDVKEKAGPAVVFDANAGVSAGVSAQGDTEINYTKPQRWIPPVDLREMVYRMGQDLLSIENLIQGAQGMFGWRTAHQTDLANQSTIISGWRSDLEKVIKDMEAKFPMIGQPMVPSDEAEMELREAFENLADSISNFREFNKALGATDKQTRAAIEEWEIDCKRAFRDYYENKKAAENHDKLDDIQMRELKENLKLKSSLVEAMTSERDGWKKEWELMNTKNREVELAIREVLSDRDAAQKEAVRWESEYRKMEAKWMESGQSSPENPFNVEWSDVFKGHFVVNTGVFPFDVIVSVNETREELMQFLDADRFPYLQDFDKDHEGYDHPSCDAMTYGTDAGPIIMRFKRLNHGRRQMGFLAHEIFHAVEFMLHRLNVPHDVWKTSEVYAYLLQYLTEQIHENLGLVVFRVQ